MEQRIEQGVGQAQTQALDATVGKAVEGAAKAVQAGEAAAIDVPAQQPAD